MPVKIKSCAAIILAVVILLSAVGCGGSATTTQLKISIVGQGSVTPDGGTYTYGTTVTLTAAPKSHWLFDHWEGDISGSLNPALVSMDSDKSVTAYFFEYDYTGSDLKINTTSLPAWIEGNYASFSLNATGGTGSLTWIGTPPEPWLVFSPSGVLSGVPPLLSAGTSMRTLPPFTVTVIDEASHAREATYTITVLPKAPEIILNEGKFVWDENDPPYGNIIKLGIVQSGVPPYRMGIPDSFGLPLGMSLELSEDGTSLVLIGPPPKARFDQDIYQFQIYVVDSNNTEASADIVLVVIKEEPVEEVFTGTFSGPFGTVTGGDGGQFALSLSGTITVTLTHNDDGTVTGTASVPTYVDIVVTYSPPGVTMTANPFSVTTTGTVSGTDASLTGTFTQTANYPLNMEFTGVLTGNTITCSIVFSKTFVNNWTLPDGTSGVSYPALSTTISNIVLTRK